MSSPSILVSELLASEANIPKTELHELLNGVGIDTFSESRLRTQEVGALELVGLAVSNGEGWRLHGIEEAVHTVLSVARAVQGAVATVDLAILLVIIVATPALVVAGNGEPQEVHACHGALLVVHVAATADGHSSITCVFLPASEGDVVLHFEELLGAGHRCTHALLHSGCGVVFGVAVEVTAVAIHATLQRTHGDDHVQVGAVAVRSEAHSHWQHDVNAADVIVLATSAHHFRLVVILSKDEPWLREGGGVVGEHLFVIPENLAVQGEDLEDVALQEGAADSKATSHGLAIPAGRPVTTLNGDCLTLHDPEVAVVVHVDAGATAVAGLHWAIERHDVWVTPQDAAALRKQALRAEDGILARLVGLAKAALADTISTWS
mmetsp:Transcript_36935/g.86573  ORF Transcript_36935/g.86573 Transcript_36935/m.86573 type:complete len:379 (+) Transcript_36935:544-1680(+)